MIPSKQEWTDALILRHGEELQKKFEQATVAVCGLGGLGSNISIFLARAGIGKLILIDFDEVDVTNLQRQQYKATQVGQYKTEAISENLREIAPYLEIEAINAKISEDNFESLLKDSGVLSDGQLKTFQGYLDRTVAVDDLMQFLEIMTDWLKKR